LFSKCKLYKNTNIYHVNFKEEFENAKGVIRIVYRRRTENTLAKRKITKGQTTIYKTYT
jgi:hypothetical protein